MIETTEAFLLEVKSCRSTYTLIRQLDRPKAEEEPMVDDEYIVNVKCELIRLPKRHLTKHEGKVIEFSLLGSERYDKKHKHEQEFFGSFKLKGKEGGGFAYLPTARLCVVENNLRSTVFKYIEVTTSSLRYGDGQITMLHFSDLQDEPVD